MSTQVPTCANRYLSVLLQRIMKYHSELDSGHYVKP